MNRIQKILGSAMIASLFAIMPLVASANALHASSSPIVIMNGNGIVRVIGANVTAVSNGVVSAFTTIGNVVMNWVVNVSASTKVSANGSKTATTTDIKVGDKVAFKGALTSSTGSTLSVSATNIRELVTFPFRRVSAGTISSVSTANGSFILINGDKVVTVQTNASTSISVNGATTTLASLKTGEKVTVAGTPNADGSIITASKIAVRDPSAKKTEKDEDKSDKNNTSGNANARVEAKSNEGHAGLNLLGGLHFGIGKGK